MPIGLWSNSESKSWVMLLSGWEAWSFLVEWGWDWRVIDAQPPRYANQFRQRLEIHLLHDLCAVGLDGFLRDSKLVTDLFVEHPGHDQFQHFALAEAEAIIALPEVSQPRRFLPCLDVPCDGLSHGGQQGVGIERLGQEVHGAGSHGSHGCRNVAVTGNEHHGQSGVLRGQGVLEAQTVEAGKCTSRTAQAGASGSGSRRNSSADANALA
jgi:hypothetical protein